MIRKKITITRGGGQEDWGDVKSSDTKFQLDRKSK